jgi:hypothetical protein
VTSAAGDALTILLGLTVITTVRLVGDLPVGEILVLVLVAPIFVMYHKRGLRTDLRILYCLQALWLLSQILTDIYRRTPSIDWVRGNAGIVFFFMDLLFITMLITGNQRRKIMFITALGIGSMLSTLLFPTDFSSSYPWKFGYSMGVNLLAVLIASILCNKQRYIIALIVLLGISAVNMAVNFRSPVLLFLVTIALAMPVIPEYIGAWRVLPPLGSYSRLWILIALAVGASLVAFVAVKTLSVAGYLGEEAQQKNTSQAQVKGGLLIGGRPEIVVSSQAVIDSPILGHGSWAKDYHYTELLYDRMREYGLIQQEDLDSVESNGEGVIPSHSHLMGAWVFSGIGGALFWFYLLWMVSKAIFRVSLKRPPFSPLLIYLCIGNVWDILFSPFGASRRLIEGFLIVMTFDLLRDSGMTARSLLPLRRNTWQRGQFVPRVPVTAQGR